MLEQHASLNKVLKLVKIKQLLKFIYEFDNNDNNVQCSSCQKDLGVEQLTDYQRHDSRFKSSVASIRCHKAADCSRSSLPQRLLSYYHALINQKVLNLYHKVSLELHIVPE